LLETAGIIGAIDNFYNFANAPDYLRPLNPIANQVNNAVRELPGGDSKIIRALYLTAGIQGLKKALSGVNPYVQWNDFKIKLI